MEGLRLLGSADTYGIGNLENNVLTGNSGRNLLSGRAGQDTLDGGFGNDRLTGGANADVFIFGKGTGQDRVLDFNAGSQDHDVIDLSAVYVGDFSFEAIQTHLSQHGKDVWIDFDGEGRLILEDVKLAHLTSEHFIATE